MSETELAYGATRVVRGTQYWSAGWYNERGTDEAGGTTRRRIASLLGRTVDYDAMVHPLVCYAHAMRRPVLTAGMLLQAIPVVILEELLEDVVLNWLELNINQVPLRISYTKPCSMQGPYNYAPMHPLRRCPSQLCPYARVAY
eukprot:1033875-Rhodomonas_salina.5